MTEPVADRVTAPFGARVVPILERAEHGAYVVLTCADGDGPAPAPGQFYMLMAARRWGGGADERPYLPRAFSVLRAAGGTLQFLLEAVGPGTSRLCELGGGDGLSILGPLGRGFVPPREGRRAVLCGGGVGIAPLALWQDTLGPGTPALLGFRDAAHAAGARIAARRPCGHRRRLAGPPRPGHRAARRRARRRPGGGGVRLRAAGDARGRPGTVRAAATCPVSSRWSRAWPAGTVRCFGCVVPTARGLIRLCLEGPVLPGSELGPEAFATPGHGA